MMKFPFANIEAAFPDHFDTQRDDNHIRTLEEAAYDRSPASFAACIGVSTRTLYRWRRQGWVPAKYADEIAIANRRHPWTIWPEHWPAYLDELVKADEKRRADTRRRTQEYRQRLAEDEAERMPY